MVHKMGLILRSLERIPKMQFSMARKFMLQPLGRYDVKLTENRTNLILRLMRHAQGKIKQHRKVTKQFPWIPNLVLYNCATLILENTAKL
jgi:hypothetical protein